MFAYRRKKRLKIISFPSALRWQKIKANWRVLFSVAAVILFAAGLAYLMIWSPVFKIKNLSVEGVNFAPAPAQAIADQFLKEKLWYVVPRDSLVTFSGRELVSRLKLLSPEIESATISQDIAKGAKIIIQGRQSAAIWCQTPASSFLAMATSTEADDALPQSEKCFFSDDDGFIFREAPEIYGLAWPTFFGQPGQPFQLGQRAAASTTVFFASQLKKQLRAMEIEPFGFRLGVDSDSDIVVFTGDGWQIYFNLKRSLQSQIKILEALLDGDLKNLRGKLKYVDLRLTNKIYYR